MENTNQKKNGRTLQQYAIITYNYQNLTTPNTTLIRALPPVAASKDQRNAAPLDPRMVLGPVHCDRCWLSCSTPLGNWEKHYTFQINHLHSLEVPRYVKVTTWSDFRLRGAPLKSM